MFTRDHHSATCPNCERRHAETANCDDCGKIICTDCAGCEINSKLTCNTCLEDLLTPGEPQDEETQSFGIKCGMHWLSVRPIFGGFIAICGKATEYATAEQAKDVLDALVQQDYFAAGILEVEPLREVLQ